MSAICGLINFDGAPINPDLLREMAEAASHHGPDGIRYWIEGNVGVAHLAFNTTPESLNERQPLVSTNGAFCLVADARVDNRPELIAKLSENGYGITSASSDADLILASYQYWGEKCSIHIIGDFVFAIWDKSKRHFFCSRDIFGFKPLVYSNNRNFFCFATEAQQLLKHPEISSRLDEIAVADFLAVNNQEQTRTFFENIKFVPPAHCLISSSINLDIQRYWDFDPTEKIIYSKTEDYADHFRELFFRAVGDRLRSNFPTVGVELSGGLDSSSVAVVANKLLTERNSGRLSAYTFIYDKIKTVDERGYAKIVADVLNIESTFVNNDTPKFISNNGAPSFESPFRWFEWNENNLLQAFQNHNGQVMLTGAGGDDLVSGSTLIYADQMRKGDLKAMLKLRQVAKDYNKSFPWILYSWFVRPHIPKIARSVIKKIRKRPNYSLPPWLHQDFVARTNIQERVSLKIPNLFQSWASQANYRVASQASNTYRNQLQWMSRIGIKKNVEYRHPFLDRRLYEFVLRLPPEQLWHDGLSKYILRQSLSDLLPEAIRLRPDKVYYSDTVSYCLKVLEVKPISLLLEKPITAKIGFVDQEKLNIVLDSYFTNKVRQPLNYILMRLISLEYWLRYHHSQIILE